MKRLIAIALLLALSASAQFNPPVQLLDTGLLGPFTAAQIRGMFGTPISIIAAPGTGKTIRIVSALINVVYGGTPFAAGGSWGFYYSQAAPPTSAAASVFTVGGLTAVASNQLFAVNFALTTTTNYVNQPVVLSNVTQAFTGGTNSTFYVEVKYYIQSGLQ